MPDSERALYRTGRKILDADDLGRASSRRSEKRRGRVVDVLRRRVDASNGGRNLSGVKTLSARKEGKVIEYLGMRMFSDNKKLFPKIKGYQLKQILIPVADANEQEKIVKIVDCVLAAKKADANADTSALEAEIDEKVFDLYGLTPEEREIVKGGVK